MSLTQASDSLGPWTGLAVFAGWVAVTLAGAAYRLWEIVAGAMVSSRSQVRKTWAWVNCWVA